MYPHTRRAHPNSKRSASVKSASIKIKKNLKVMASQMLLLFAILLSVHGAPNIQLKPLAESEQKQNIENEKEDLKSASSSYSHQYSDWRGRYPSGYEFSVTGYGTIDDRSSANYGDVGGYNNVGYNGNPGYSTGYGTYKGYDGYGQSGQNGYEGVGGYSVNSGYGGNAGYGGNYIGNGGSSGGYGGYGSYGGSSGYSGNGGYGGNGGNGGISSYYGYNNPYYQGNNHLGYGYYSKRPGYGNIYNSGVTPSLVTGYRGYSK